MRPALCTTSRKCCYTLPPLGHSELWFVSYHTCISTRYKHKCSLYTWPALLYNLSGMEGTALFYNLVVVVKIFVITSDCVWSIGLQDTNVSQVHANCRVRIEACTENNRFTLYECNEGNHSDLRDLIPQDYSVAWARSILDSVTRPPRSTLSRGRSKLPLLANPNAVNWLWRPTSLEKESSRSDASSLKAAEAVPNDSRKVILFLTLARIRIRGSLETAVEWMSRDGKKGIRLWREHFMYAAVTVRLL
jgi:hypothetical protein